MADTLTLRNEVKIPAIGAGCAYGDWVGATDFCGFLPEKAWRGTELAIQAGARHFDMALCYGTHRHVADVLSKHFINGDLERKDVFLTTKLVHPPAPPHVNISPGVTMSFAQNEEALRAGVQRQLDRSLTELGVGYVDLLLVHWPGSFEEKDAAHARMARRVIWSEFEAIYKKKQARAIGVCNFSIRHMKELVEDGVQILPMVNQLEVHPYCYDRELIEFCQQQGILVEAYAPFASGAFGMLKDEVLQQVATKCQRGVGQVILRWLLQKGCAMLPKSSSPGRMKENHAIFDFELSQEDMALIDSLHANGTAARRSCPDPDTVV